MLMTNGLETLTEKEKETLRLLVRGHDAKSIASSLGLSVHTINERLREARRKLHTSSSREAARLLLEQEHGAPDSHGDKLFGDDLRGPATDTGAVPPASDRRPSRVARLAAGGITMLVVSGLLVLAALSQSGPVAADQSAATAAADRDVAAAANAWLALVDGYRWRESWEGTTPTFQKTNTAAVWESVSKDVRVPLGQVRSRTLIDVQEVPTPPAGAMIVRYRTDFANKPGATEKLSLMREAGGWRIGGYIIE